MARGTQTPRRRARAKAPRPQLATLSEAARKSLPGPVTWAGAATPASPSAATSPSKEDSQEESEVSEEERCSWESPVRGRGWWCTSTEEEDEEEDEEWEEEEEGEEEYDSEDSADLKENQEENQATEQRENQAAIPSVEEVVGSLGSKLQEFVKAGSGFVLEMDNMRGREVGEIDAVVKVALQMVSKSFQHSRQLVHSLMELQSASAARSKRDKRDKNRLSKAGKKAASFPEEIKLLKGATSVAKRPRLNCSYST